MRKKNPLFYCIGQGIRNTWKNRMYFFASAGTIMACLLLLGVIYFVMANFNHAVKSAETLVGITVFFEEGTEEARILEIKEQIEPREEVADVVYISAEEAWENYKKDNLNEELSQTFGTDNPLIDSASLEVSLSDVTMQKALVSYVESIEDVRKVNHSESIAESFAGIKNLIWVISVGLIVLLMVVAVFLIRTTIATGINARREEISMMSIIGATDFFIRAPFVVEGALIGVLGCILPIGVLYIAYGEVVRTLQEQFASALVSMNFIERAEIMRQFVTLALVFSLGIGILASYITAVHQIRKIELQH